MAAQIHQACHRLRFGLFEFDAAGLELERAGRPVRLQPQPAKVLAYLASRPGALVQRDDLQRHIWGDAFVDAEAGLNACIRDIRAALGDRAEAPTYVATVPRRGYRFIAPVEMVGEPAAEEHPVLAKPSRPRRRWAQAAAMVAVAVGGLGLHAAIRSNQSAPRGAEPVDEPRVVLQVVPVAGSTPEVDPAAREAVLEARYLLARFDRENARRAVERAQRAVELEADWGDAWLVLGDALLAHQAPPHETMPAARDAFKRALTHDPTLAAAHSGLARVQLNYDWDLEAARRELDLAQQLGGASSELHQSWAFYHLTAGRPEKALEHLHEALRLDPVSARLRGDIGMTYGLVGDHQQAIEQCRKGLELDPEATWLYGCLVESYRAQGRLDLATQAARHEMKARDQMAAAPLADAAPDTVLHAHDQWRLRRMLDASADHYVPACAIGIRQAQAGHTDEAIRQFQIAFDERSSFMPLMEIVPVLTMLHDDPRFQELAKRVQSEVRGAVSRPPRPAGG